MNSILLEIISDIKLILTNNYAKLSTLYSLKEMVYFLKNVEKNTLGIQQELRRMSALLLRLHSNSCNEWQKNKTIYQSINHGPIQILVKVLSEDIVERLMPNVSSSTSNGTYTFNMRSIKDYEDICYWSLLGLLEVTAILGDVGSHIQLEFNMIDSTIVINELANIYKYRELWKEFSGKYLSKDSKNYKVNFLVQYAQYLDGIA